MQSVVIRPVEKRDLSLLDTALRALSEELDDKHPASIEFLEQAGFGATPAYYALIALNTNNTLCGVIVFSPVMSTTMAATGLYVSDLWVSQAVRGGGLGRRLLAHATQFSFTKWRAQYLKLAVYDESTDARRFYDQLGLTERKGETTLFLERSGVNALRGEV